MTNLSSPINGVLLLDKPPGLSSNSAVQKVRRVYEGVKAGHTGTLDPLATGLLPICLGESTKFTQSLLDADKSYDAVVKLGWSSSTGDAEGQLTVTAAPDFDDAMLLSAASRLTGEVQQIPPMHSALKMRGKPLYELARAGKTIERAARTIRIHALDVVRREVDVLSLSVRCSKGTYIRVLAEDLGRLLGCGAYLSELRRVAIGDIAIGDAIDLDAVNAMSPEHRLSVLKPIDFLLTSLPPVFIEDRMAQKFKHGMSINDVTGEVGSVRVYEEQERFLGLADLDESGVLRPRRLVSQSSVTRVSA